mgnify:CR=1 FL=1
MITHIIRTKDNRLVDAAGFSLGTINSVSYVNGDTDKWVCIRTDDRPIGIVTETASVEIV